MFFAEPLGFPDAPAAVTVAALGPPALEFGFLLAAAILDELTLAAELIIFNALLASDLALPALVTLGPCRTA